MGEMKHSEATDFSKIQGSIQELPVTHQDQRRLPIENSRVLFRCQFLIL